MAELEDLIYSGVISPRAAGKNGFEMPSAASASLGQTMPPEPVQEAIKGMAEPVTNAGWLLGGAMQGSQRPSTMDIIKAAGGLGLAAMPMGPGRASMLARGLETAADTAPTAIRAYHGSPHDFSAFDLSKIGTGEGAQAYGHGLYFAQNEATAKAYRDQLTASDPAGNMFYKVGDKYIKDNWANKTPESIAAKLLFDRNNDKEGVLRIVDQLQKNGDRVMNWPEVRKNVESMGKVTLEPNIPGKMYEVNINAHPEHFLDWEKPMSEQSPVVRQAFLDNLQRRKWPQEKIDDVMGPNTTGQQALNYIMPSGNRSQATEVLHEAGIPGIRYLDQGSRGDFKIFSKGSDQYGIRKPDGTEYPLSFSKEAAQSEVDRQNSYAKTHNYVVFNDKLIDIIKKYGLAGLIAGGAYHGQLPAKQGVT